ncbi:MAG: isomerase, partial [Pseudomonadota bacterium]|nr:isomerase [Pseudomonadota bacterium]
TLFYWIGNAVENRALTMGDNPMGEASLLSVIGFLPGLPSVILAPVILYIGARAALRAIQE